MPGSVVCSYQRTFTGDTPFQDGVAVAVTAGVDRQGRLVKVDYHLVDVTYSPEEVPGLYSGWDGSDENR